MADLRELEGTLNFREVGGLPVGDGLRMRRGLLYRSDTLQFLTAASVRSLVEEVGLRTVLDLRLPYELEVEGRGALAQAPVRHLSLPFQVAGAEQEGSAVPVLDPDDPMLPHYLGYLSTSPRNVAAVVTELALGELPAVVHCTAGKDRTGVAIAVVLTAIGVSAHDVATEYAAGSAAIPAIFDRLRTMETYRDKVDDMPAASRLSEAGDMLRFLAAVDERLGGVPAYLRANGVADETLAALRARFTEPAI